ncbi:MAG: hypothetical protein ACI9B8_002768 [Sulfitobacter sp.]
MKHFNKRVLSMDGLGATNAAALIAEVNASDLARAREAIAGGIKSAKEQWIPSELVVYALALELQSQIAGEQPSPELAIYLRRLADFVSADSTSIHRH